MIYSLSVSDSVSSESKSVFTGDPGESRHGSKSLSTSDSGSDSGSLKINYFQENATHMYYLPRGVDAWQDSKSRQVLDRGLPAVCRVCRDFPAGIVQFFE